MSYLERLADVHEVVGGDSQRFLVLGSDPNGPVHSLVGKDIVNRRANLVPALGVNRLNLVPYGQFMG